MNSALSYQPSAFSLADLGFDIRLLCQEIVAQASYLFAIVQAES